MADVTTAGTLIAAVLEESGYLAQAHFLKDFRDFFREAGALVYILGGIGGVVSMVMFGSFRAARYLLLGPALYWFLVGPTTKYDGVIWQVGGGAPRGLDAARGEAASRAAVNAAVKDSGLSQGDVGNIEVAAGFALFARPINSIVQGLVDLILNDEDGEYLQHISKGRALEMLLSVQPEDPAFLEMLEGDFAQKCADMVGYAVARSSYELRDEVLAGMGAAKDSAEKRKEFYEQEFKKFRDATRINPGSETRKFMRAGGIDPEQQQAISCDSLWKLIGQYLYDQAKPISERVLKLAEGDGKDANLACERLLEKIEPNRAPGAACNIQNVVALYLLKNAFYDRRSMGRFVKRITDSMGEPQASGEGARIAVHPNTSPEFLQSAKEFALRVRAESPQLFGYTAPMSPMDEYQYAVGVGELGAQNIQDEIEKQKFRENVQSVARTSAIGGPLDAGFTEYPRYHLRNLRQQLFTWAMCLPYWQGVLLYILAVAYPFMALLVLLPGRAMGFLNLPLAWLWVKSWDVGLAFVMVFERVLWNLLPSLEVSKLVTDKKLAQTDLWQALSEAQKYDHTWNLHLYYICISMATLSIPAITGYCTLRSKRAVLSSFTDKIQSDAKEAGSRAAGAFGMSVMSDRVQMIKELQGLAARSVTDRGEGLGANNRQEAANAVAVTSALTRAFGSTLGVATAGDNVVGKALGAGAGAWSEYVNTRGKMLGLQARFDMDWTASFDPILGRYGKLATMNEAYAAAMDGSGGFELNAHMVSPIDKYIELQTENLSNAYTFASRLAVVNPGLSAAIFAATENPETLPDAIQKVAESLPANAFIEGLRDRAKSESDGQASGNLAHPFNNTPSMWEKTFGIDEHSISALRDSLAHRDQFREEYTLRREELIQDLPKSKQAELLHPTIGYGVEFNGANGGASLFRDYVPSEQLKQNEPFKEWRQENPGVGGSSTPNGADAAPSSGGVSYVPPEQGSTSFASSGTPRGPDVFANISQEDLAAIDPMLHPERRRINGEEQETPEERKNRLAALNLDLLLIDPEEKEEILRERRWNRPAPSLSKKV